MARGSTITSSRSSRSPPISTSSTSFSASSRSRRSLASRTRARSETGPERLTVTTGLTSAMVTSWTVGSSVSPGSFALARLTASRTSVSARLGSKPATNSRVTEAWPSPADAFISLTPSMDRSSRSIGRTSIRSASSGDMPSWLMET